MGLKNHPQMVVVYGIFCASHIIHQYISYVYIIIYISIISSLFIINPWYNHIMIMYNRYIPTYDIPRYIQSITRFGWWKTHLCDTQVVAADNFAESLWASGTLHLSPAEILDFSQILRDLKAYPSSNKTMKNMWFNGHWLFFFRIMIHITVKWGWNQQYWLIIGWFMNIQEMNSQLITNG